LVRITPGELHLGSGTPKALNAIGHGPPTTAECEAAYGVPCYQPAQIQTAYDLKPLLDQGIDGKGETIVIVDAFGSPTIGKDLEQFDKAFGLPAPPSLTVLQPAGPVPPYVADNLREGWAGETDLDVEYSHVMAPGANILLVETPTNENEGTSGFPQIETAEKYVIAHHLGGVISQSFSATEQSFPSKASLQALRGAYVDAAHSGVTVLAASGDSGAADVGPNGRTYYDFPVTSWPDSDPLVTGVGGVQLHLSDSGLEVHHRRKWAQSVGRRRWPICRLLPTRVSKRGKGCGGDPTRCARHRHECRLRRGGRRVSGLPRTGGLVFHVRYQRGHPAIRRCGGTGGSGGGPSARTDQFRALLPVGEWCAGHRRCHRG
jgi:subtilase family serine protease